MQWFYTAYYKETEECFRISNKGNYTYLVQFQSQRYQMVFRKRYIVNGVINCINLPDFCSDVNCNSRVRKAVCDSRFLGKTRYITSLRAFQPPLSSKYKHSLKTSETNRMLTEIRFTLLVLVSSVLESDLSCN